MTLPRPLPVFAGVFFRRVITWFGIVLPLLAATVSACPRVKHDGTSGGPADAQWRAGGQALVLWLTLPTPEVKLPGGMVSGKDPQNALGDGRVVPVRAMRGCCAARSVSVAAAIASRRPGWVGIVEIRV